ncbi:MAG TPA: UDP-N-acetylglucosamine 2-epimerase (non-hydrolyzing), partial [Dissulfurispiraceae bacterium]|nr:UDP-N-acetylglucosamine 2-epimerase (non-hydrolyzing) [Dissulfurispiraceae bacterium]
MKKHVMLIFGTRPEAIKMAPVVREFQRHVDKFKTTVCVTAQHRQMLDQVLDLFGIKPDIDLDLMQAGQTLAQLTARALTGLEAVMAENRPDWVFVQGDTTTVMAASIAAFYQGIRVGHVEAGLRTNNKRAPFPEEINRRVTSVIADLHFAPTERARKALLAEGVPADKIHITGNTVIDALLWVKDRLSNAPPEITAEMTDALRDKKMVLVTGHRRESFGATFENICLAVKELVAAHEDICVIYP